MFWWFLGSDGGTASSCAEVLMVMVALETTIQVVTATTTLVLAKVVEFSLVFGGCFCWWWHW